MTDIRQLRAAAALDRPGSVPAGAARSQAFPSTLRSKMVELDGQAFAQITGKASVVERKYEMWDMFGPYDEGVRSGAFAKTLAASPDVAFLMNHRGVTMARTTTPGRLLLAAAPDLDVTALVNPKRQDVRDMILAIEDGDITEMSFAFMITAGEWSPDYSEYWITEVDLDRGDVSAVNYGANPYTSIAARSGEILAALDKLPAGAARAALDRLNLRGDIPDNTPGPVNGTGRSVALLAAQLIADEDDD